MTWCDSDYSYRKTISIDPAQVAGDEVNFPICIAVTDADLADTGNGGHVESSDGYDIIFYTSTCTLLVHEIDRYDNTDGSIVFWVRIPSLSSTVTTVIHMYYGKVGVGADPSSTDVWDANFKAVYHFNETAGAVVNDSTSNGNDGAYNGNLPTRVDDNIGGQDFDGANDFVTFPIGAHVDVSGTHEAFIEGDDNGTINVLLNDFDVDGSHRRIIEIRYNDNKHYINVKGAGDWVDYPVLAPVATPTYYALLYENGAQAWWMDDVEIDTGAVATEVWAGGDVSTRRYIGCNASEAQKLNGTIYEWRISDIVRSDNWITTTYNTITDPAGFVDWGAEEPQPNIAPDKPDNPSPVDDDTDVELNPDLSVHVGDDDGDSMDVTFYDASDDSVIDVDLGVVDGGVATVEWSDLDYGTVYSWYAIADDGIDTTQSDTWSFTTEEKPATLPDTAYFALTSTTTVVYMSMPEWEGEERGIDKNIDVINFWTDEIDVIDKDKKSEPLVLTGVETGICFEDDLAQKFQYIWDMQNNHDEVTITNLGDCMDGVYIIRNFHFETIPGSSTAFRWSMSLEFVRDIA